MHKFIYLKICYIRKQYLMMFYLLSVHTNLFMIVYVLLHSRMQPDQDFDTCVFLLQEEWVKVERGELVFIYITLVPRGLTQTSNPLGHMLYKHRVREQALSLNLSSDKT